jgi:DNA-binding beta-propeller fold protein YncE
MTIIKDALYVADTGNHAIRRIRLLSAEVETVAGTGQPGAVIARDHADPRTVPLNSPVDVSGSAERLFIANAANNQVWVLDLGRNRIGVFVGSGHHGFVDGTGEGAQLAKPMGLATQAQMLYIADADSSSIRAVRFIDNNVKTLIGAGLYEFGDADGLPDKARLQHPTGVALDPGGSILWVADTYNNKIKALSLRGGGARTLALPYRFHEPTGISVAAKSLWIANTNAHEIVRIDTGSGQIKRLPVGE